MIAQIETSPAVMNRPLPVPPPDDGSDAPESDKMKALDWLSKIKQAKSFFEDDFKRMKKDMSFVAGKQWDGQKTLEDGRYISNMTLRMVNQKVSTLYAKDPEVRCSRRPRLDYAIWDGEIQALMQSVQQATEMQMQGLPLPPDINALFADYQNGRRMRQMLDQVCKTLQLAYSYFVDVQRPEFKEQLKQLVRRVVICGVGFIRPKFINEDDELADYTLSSIDIGSTNQDRAQRLKEIIDRLQKKEIDPNSAEISTLKSLLLSLGASASPEHSDTELSERLEFDCPPSWSIIVDPGCRNLKEFVNARWIAQVYPVRPEVIRAVFGKDVKPGAVGIDGKGQPITNVTESKSTKYIELYEVFDYVTKTCLFVCDGCEGFVSDPTPPYPSVAGFWQHFALTFNDIEPFGDESTEIEDRASVYPPSDVFLMRHPQKEWNRTRNSLRAQRNANAPKYLVRKGYFTEQDKLKLVNAQENEVIEVEGVPPDVPLDKAVVVMQVAQIDPRVYDTTPLEQDTLLSGGMQQANLGPAQPNVTATVGTIAEQSRLSVSSSNVDDLDGLLTRLAKAGCEMLLRACSEATIRQIVGPGASWPSMPATRESLVKSITISIKAASSGRPNKAVDVANWQQLAPMMIQAGANPIGIIEETARRLDDTMETDHFYPIIPKQISPNSLNEGEGQPSEVDATQSLLGTGGAGLTGTSPNAPTAAGPYFENEANNNVEELQANPT